MALISFQFFCLLSITALCYYICPGRYRYLVLTGASGYYYYRAEGWQSGLYLLGFIVLFVVSAALMRALEDRDRLKRGVYFVTLAAALGALWFVKYRDPLGMTAPPGISFWMLTGIGYVTDVYRGGVTGGVSPARTALFLGFFPLMTSGPILRYRETAERLTEPHRADYRQIMFGVQRILWGCFKKLVISERLAVIVNTVYADVQTYRGFYILFAVCCFSLQLYTDFSGCMDIVLGAGQIFGIRLPENFQTPFFSKNVSEFWRRWHITLGAWLKDYVLYPLLHSGPFRSMKKGMKKRFGKIWGERVPTYLGMFVSWFLIGLWHGGSVKYIFGVGLWFWAVIVAGELLTPAAQKLADRLRINRTCFSWRLFQSLRTFAVVTFGLSFFRAASAKEGLKLWAAALQKWNPQALLGSSILTMGLDLQDMIVVTAACLVLLWVSVMQYRGVHIREWFAGQNLALRWFIYIALFFCCIIFGKYGAGYNAADFIYQGF